MVKVQDLEHLIIDLKESLEREIQNVGEKVDRLNDRFDTQAARLGRHAGLLQTGGRWTNRMNEWAERVDASLEKKDRLLSELSDRVRKLEEGQK